MDYDEQWDKICSENLSEKEFEEFKTTLKKNIFNYSKREEKMSFYNSFTFFEELELLKYLKHFLK